MAWRIPVLLVAALVIATCSAAQTPVPSRVVGVVVDVRARSLTQVDGFMLKSGNRTYDITIDPDRDYAFPPSHLRAHLASGQPVAVGLEERDERLYAVSLEDA